MAVAEVEGTWAAKGNCSAFGSGKLTRGNGVWGDVRKVLRVSFAVVFNSLKGVVDV